MRHVVVGYVHTARYAVRQAVQEEPDSMSKSASTWAQLILLTGLLSGCAILHATQVGDVDSQIVMNGERFEIKLTEMGVDLEEVAEFGNELGRMANRDKEAEGVMDLMKMANSGPKTGYPVFDVKYSDGLMDKIKAACPSGKVSGLTSVRETADYGMVSGEIVKLVGYCAKGD